RLSATQPSPRPSTRSSADTSPIPSRVGQPGAPRVVRRSPGSYAAFGARARTLTAWPLPWPREVEVTANRRPPPVDPPPPEPHHPVRVDVVPRASRVDARNVSHGQRGPTGGPHVAMRRHLAAVTRHICPAGTESPPSRPASMSAGRDQTTCYS